MDNNTTCHKGQYLIYIGEEKEGLQPFDDVIVQEDRGETIQGFISGRFRAFFKAELLERKNANVDLQLFLARCFRDKDRERLDETCAHWREELRKMEGTSK